ncbi:MAG: hypothetical protein AAF465_15830 [Pseudomonadota bacterium]
MLKEIFTDLAKFLLGLAVPVVLVLIGAGLIAAAMHFEVMALFWVGGVVAAAGVLWGAILVLFHSDV